MFRVSTTILFLALAALLAPVKTAPTFLLPRQNSSSDFQLQNALDAQQLNIEFLNVTANDTCTDGDEACITSAFAQCVSGTWALTPCAAQTACFALPLVTKPGTSISCGSQADAEARFVAAGVTNGTGAAVPSASGNSTVPATTGGDNGDCSDGSTATSSASSAGSAVTPAASSTSGSQLYKRQFSNITLVTITENASTGTAAASSTLSASLSSTATLTTASSVTTASPAATASSVSPAAPSISTTASNTFSDPVPIQTAIGTDGLPTVTVTRTITMSCGAPTPASLSTSALSTVVITSATLAGTPSASSAGLPASSNTVSSGVTVRVSTNTPASGTPTLSPSAASTVLPLSSSPSPIVSPTPPVTPTPSGFTFNTGAPASTTIAPGNNNGAVSTGSGASSSVDLSELLTATVG